jgi:hypothetical protein
MDDSEISTAGRILYNAQSGSPTATECYLLGGGGNLEATTGALAGTTGTNGKTTVSAHSDGKVYVESRKGTSNITVLFLSNVWSV